MTGRARTDSARRPTDAVASSSQQRWPGISSDRLSMAVREGLAAARRRGVSPGGTVPAATKGRRLQGSAGRAGPEDMIADLVNGVVQPAERVADPLAGNVRRLVGGGP